VSKHPANYFVKYVILANPTYSDPEVNKILRDWGFLDPTDPKYFAWMRSDISPPPNFDPANKLHRPSMKFLREEKVYDIFYPGDAMQEAWDILSNPEKRLVVEQVLLARLDTKDASYRINKKQNWYLTAKGLELFRHYFWNVGLLTFDEWGRYLYGRAALYERYMSLLQGSKNLAYFHLRLDQAMESKHMLKRAQEICFFTLEEAAQKPGTGIEKVKAITTLTKSLVDCHNALSTSDMALKDVLSQFENFRMKHPEVAPPSIRTLAPHGNYSDSGVEEEKEGLH
jgi:hypothetical protein